MHQQVQTRSALLVLDATKGIPLEIRELNPVQAS